jgi:hypothetical protein
MAADSHCARLPRRVAHNVVFKPTRPPLVREERDTGQLIPDAVRGEFGYLMAWNVESPPQDCRPLVHLSSHDVWPQSNAEAEVRGSAATPAFAAVAGGMMNQTSCWEYGPAGPMALSNSILETVAEKSAGVDRVKVAVGAVALLQAAALMTHADKRARTICLRHVSTPDSQVTTAVQLVEVN